MSAKRDVVNQLLALDPADAAERLVAKRGSHIAWLDEFQQQIDRQRAGQALARVLDAWGLSQAQAAKLFGVSRQAVSKWLDKGPPSERSVAIADLSAATDLLVHYLKRERISAVVRRGIPSRSNKSLLDLVAGGDTAATLMACREMFSFDQASG